MKLTQFALVILLVAAFASGIGIFWNTMITTTTADLGYTNRNLSDFGVFNETTDIVNKVNESMQVIDNAQTDDPPATGIEFLSGVSSFLTSAGQTAYMVLFDVPSIFINLITDVTEKTGLVPEWFEPLLIAMVSIMAIAAILYFIFGREI